jgi:hypothetical protein
VDTSTDSDFNSSSTSVFVQFQKTYIEFYADSTGIDETTDTTYVNFYMI